MKILVQQKTSDKKRGDLLKVLLSDNTQEDRAVLISENPILIEIQSKKLEKQRVPNGFLTNLIVAQVEDKISKETGLWYDEFKVWLDEWNKRWIREIPKRKKTSN